MAFMSQCASGRFSHEQSREPQYSCILACMSQTWGKRDAFYSLNRSVFMLSWETEKSKGRSWGRSNFLCSSTHTRTHTHIEKKERMNTFLDALRQICRLQGRGYCNPAPLCVWVYVYLMGVREAKLCTDLKFQSNTALYIIHAWFVDQ